VRFRYRAATAEGGEVDGVLDAATRAAALDALRRRALVPIALDDVDGAPAPRVAAPRLLRSRARGGESVALFARTLATLLEAGVPLDRALAFTAEQATDPTVGAALTDVRDAVRSGSGLSAALARHPRLFGPLVTAMLGAGEAAGALAPAAARLADHLDEAAELRALVRSALLYPALMAGVAAVGVTVLLLVVVPRFVAMLGEIGGALPLSTRLLVGASRALVGGWWAWLLLAVAAVAAARGWLAAPGNRARWHAARLALPVVGALEQRWATARVARTLGLLLAGGARLLPALRVAAGAAPNLAVAAGVERAAARVAEGERLAPALAGVVPPLAAQLLAVGEETGRLGPMAERVADVYDVEVRRALRTSVALLEPALIVLFGVVVGFVALALLQAVYAVDPGRL
jgi:type II secretory pathway component PulF